MKASPEGSEGAVVTRRFLFSWCWSGFGIRRRCGGAGGGKVGRVAVNRRCEDVGEDVGAGANEGIWWR